VDIIDALFKQRNRDADFIIYALKPIFENIISNMRMAADTQASFSSGNDKIIRVLPSAKLIDQPDVILTLTDCLLGLLPLYQPSCGCRASVTAFSVIDVYLSAF
jgi:hypothetical protein